MTKKKSRACRIVHPNLILRFQGLIAQSGVIKTVIFLFLSYLVLAVLFAFIYWHFHLVDGHTRFFRSFYFSVVTQTTLGYGDLKPINSFSAMSLVIFHSTVGLFFFALAGAVMVFKLLQPVGEVFCFDKYAIFYPEEGVLRVRVMNRMPATLSHIEARAYIRTWLPVQPQGRFGTYTILLKRDLIPEMLYRDPWNIATRPADGPGSGLQTHESDRVLKGLTPAHLDKRSRITVTLLGHIDQLKSTVSGSHSYEISNIKCGSYRFVDPDGLTSKHAERFQWQNWDRFEESSPDVCEGCRFREKCILCFAKHFKEEI